MLIKKSSILVVLAALAQVLSNAGATSASAKNSTAASSYDKTLGRPCLPVEMLEATTALLYLKLPDQETATACIDCQKRALSLVSASSDCEEFSKPICQGINECKTICGMDIWVLEKEKFRCKELHFFKVLNEIARNKYRDLKNRFDVHNEKRGAKQLNWTVSKLLEDKNFRNCPSDCNEYLPGNIDIDTARRIDNVLLNISISKNQALGILPIFDIKTVHEFSTKVDDVVFPENPCPGMSMPGSEGSMENGIMSCLVTELSFLDGSYCLDCFRKLEAHVGLFEVKEQCSEILFPFCKPSWNCARCGSCRKYVNSVSLCPKEREMQCSWNCDDYSF
jgi:hypothetical protein